MKNSLYLLLVVVLGFWWFRGGKLPDFISNRTLDKKYISQIAKTDTCLGKKSCLLVYVAPWCPACKSLEPILKVMTKSPSEHGVKIIVGQGRSPGDNEKLAESYGVNGIVDSDNAYHDKLRIQHYPTVFQFDPSGKVMTKDTDAIQWAVMNILTDTDRQALFQR